MPKFKSSIRISEYTVILRTIFNMILINKICLEPIWTLYFILQMISTGLPIPTSITEPIANILFINKNYFVGDIKISRLFLWKFIFHQQVLWRHPPETVNEVIPKIRLVSACWWVFDENTMGPVFFAIPGFHFIIQRVTFASIINRLGLKLFVNLKQQFPAIPISRSSIVNTISEFTLIEYENKY